MCSLSPNLAHLTTTAIQQDGLFMVSWLRYDMNIGRIDYYTAKIISTWFIQVPKQHVFSWHELDSKIWWNAHLEIQTNHCSNVMIREVYRWKHHISVYGHTLFQSPPWKLFWGWTLYNCVAFALYLSNFSWLISSYPPIIYVFMCSHYPPLFNSPYKCENLGFRL